MYRNKDIEILSELKYKKLTSWMIQFGGWLLYFTAHYLIYYSKNTIDTPENFLRPFFAYFCVFLTSLLLLIVYNRVNYRTRSIISLTIIVFICSFAASNILFWFDRLVCVRIWGMEEENVMSPLLYYFRKVFHWGIPLMCWSILYFGLQFWWEWRLQKEETNKAYASAQSAQMQSLMYQLEPHFLFNSLNTIRALIAEDKKKAKLMIMELSEFLRYSLLSRNCSDVPLNKEIEALRHYCAIEKNRYEGKLDVEFQIHPLAENHRILCFLIYPLVENAIKYGMQTSPMPLKIFIKAKTVNGKLKVEISNTGRWIKPSTAKNLSTSGAGLDTVRQRLKNAFPDRHHFEILENEGWVSVLFEIAKDGDKTS